MSSQSRQADRPRQAAQPVATPVHACLDDLARRLPLQSIDALWIFPARRIGATESTVLVVSAFDDADADRRRVLTAHYTTRRDKRGCAEVDQTLDEHGTAPTERIGRLIDGVLRRLDPELADTPPRAVHIAGDPERWAAIVAELKESDG